MHNEVFKGFGLPKQHRRNEGSTFRIGTGKVYHFGISVDDFCRLGNFSDALLHFTHLIFTHQGAHPHLLDARVADAHFIERFGQGFLHRFNTVFRHNESTYSRTFLSGFYRDLASGL